VPSGVSKASTSESFEAAGKVIPLSPVCPSSRLPTIPATAAKRVRSSSHSCSARSRSASARCSSWYGCWLSSSRMRASRPSMVFLVRSRMARWASRSFARFFASCSGVRFATPLEPGWPAFRLRPLGAAVLFGVGICGCDWAGD